MRAYLIALILILVLSNGCTPQRRLERLIKNHPELTQADTISIIHRDTIVIQSVTHDTTTTIIKQDSVTVINNEKVFLRYYYDTLRQEIFHEVECKTDTIYYEKTIQVPIVKPVIKERVNYFWFVVVIIALLFLLYLALRNYINKDL